ncbi:STAS domain-containing protein [Streptomyces sp. NPDC057287]|uniref:STAS domain-containing protein n=1 Tax=Streptomyces sp. NPDC057287 TaxID=3346086 RepID=UPI003645A7E3
MNSQPFTLTVEPGPVSACLHLSGDLDQHSGDTVVEQAERCLSAHPGLNDLHLDCAGLTFCDSIGISSLLMIHRGTTARGVRLYLDNRPPFLQRLLDITGIEKLFTPPLRSRKAE